MRSPKLTPTLVAAGLVVVTALTSLAACGGAGDGPGITEPPAATPGVLRVRFVTPAADDGAVLLAITGPAVPTTVTATQAGATAHGRTANGVTTVAVFGRVTAGEVLRFSVPDANAAASYRAELREVAATDNALRADLTPYRATVERVDR